ncbi:MAG: Lipid A export ATP-binding/permease protein MsbA [bacterium ADurb.BinA186]|jgi:ATP-binding cassette, subfamily B, bacterial PglK|nr:MAG: Lipid A export ATP-binding/permease protein MsbA [bacterium ADurb.BinA186]
MSKKQKGIFCLLFVGMLVGSGLELFGVSILLPIISLISDPEAAVDGSSLLQFVVMLFGFSKDSSGHYSNALLITVVLLVMAIYLIKAAYTIFINALESKFTSQFYRQLSSRLFATYIYQSYEFHLYSNSADLLRSATFDTTQFVAAANTLLSLLSDGLFCLAAFVYLMINDWRVTLIVFAAIGGISFLVLRLVKKRARAYGQESWWLNTQAIKTIQEAFGGIKETIVSNREEYFVSTYDKYANEIANVSYKNAFVGLLPRVLIEAVGMISILVALLVYILSGVSNTSIIQTFSLFVIGIVKLLPYVSRINAQVNGFRFSAKSVDNVFQNLQLSCPERPQNVGLIEAAPFQKKIVLRDVTFSYRGSAKIVLDHVNCEIKKGSFTAFCGQSGAGKTTTVDLILGLLVPTQGAVLIDEKNLKENPAGWHRDISYIPQEIFLSDDDIRTNVAFGLNPKQVKDEDVWRALDQAQLGDFVRSLPNQLQTQVGEKGVRLSGGQRQRIGIARALFRNTPVIVFDEATSALDFQTESEILQTVNGLKGEKTLIIITHRLNTIQGCDRIYEIKEGKMACIKGGEPDAH